MKLYLDGATERETISKQIFLLLYCGCGVWKHGFYLWEKWGCGIAVTAPVVPSFDRTVGKRDTKKTTQSNILLVDDD